MSRSLPLLVLLVGLIAPGGASRAQELEPAAAKSKESALLAPLEKARAAFDAARKEQIAAYSAAPEGEKARAWRENAPDVSEDARALLSLVDAHGGDPLAVSALTWVLRHCEGALRKGAVDRLIADHAGSAEVGDALKGLIYADDPQSRTLVEAVVERNEHPAAAGVARYVLARQILRAGEDADPDSRQRAEKLLETVVAQHADHDLYPGRKTLGEAAKGELFELRHLAVGCEAPEIEGADAEGVAFKLSDARGKIVLLDFWGHW